MEMDATSDDHSMILTDADGNPISRSIIGYYNFIFENNMSYKTVPRLLICDVLKAEFDYITKLFSFKSYRFKQVSICGQVTGITPFKSNFVFTVDDGTALIYVFGHEGSKGGIELNLHNISQEVNESAKLPEVELELPDYKEVEEECKRLNKIADICRLMIQEANLINSSKPSANEIEVGDILVFNGTLVQYQERRYIFAACVFRIIEEDLDFRENWFNVCTAT